MPDREHDTDRERLDALRSRVTRIEDKVTVMNELVNALDAEIGGVPRLEIRNPKRLTLGDRMSLMENDRATAMAAHAATDVLREVQRRSVDRTLTVWERSLLFSLSAGTFLILVLRTAGLL